MCGLDLTEYLQDFEIKAGTKIKLAVWQKVLLTAIKGRLLLCFYLPGDIGRLELGEGV